MRSEPSEIRRYIMKKYIAPKTDMIICASEDIMSSSVGLGDVQSFKSLTFVSDDIDFSQWNF